MRAVPILLIIALVSLAGCGSSDTELRSGDRVWFDAGGYAIENNTLRVAGAEGRVIQRKDRMAEMLVTRIIGNPTLDGLAIEPGSTTFFRIDRLQPLESIQQDRQARESLLAKVSPLFLSDLVAPDGQTLVTPLHDLPIQQAERLELKDLATALRVIQAMGPMASAIQGSPDAKQDRLAEIGRWVDDVRRVFGNSPAVKDALNLGKPFLSKLRPGRPERAYAPVVLRPVIRRNLTAYAVLMGPASLLELLSHLVAQSAGPCGFDIDQAIGATEYDAQQYRQSFAVPVTFRRYLAKMLDDDEASAEREQREICRQAIERLLLSKISQGTTLGEVEATSKSIASFDRLSWVSDRPLVDPEKLNQVSAAKVAVLERVEQQRAAQRRDQWQWLQSQLKRSDVIAANRMLEAFLKDYPEDSPETQAAKEQLAQNTKALERALKEVKAMVEGFLAHAKRGDFEAASKYLSRKRDQDQYLSSAKGGWGIAKASQSLAIPTFGKVRFFAENSQVVPSGWDATLEVVLVSGDGQQPWGRFFKRDGQWTLARWW